MHASKKFHATFLLVLFFNSSLLFSASPSPTRPLSPDSAELFEDFNNSLDVISQAQARIGNKVDKSTFKDRTLAERLTIWREAARNLLENPNPDNKDDVRKILYSRSVAATALFIKPVLDLLEPQQHTAKLLADWIKVVINHQKDPASMNAQKENEHLERCIRTLVGIRLECETRKKTKTEDIQNRREEFRKNLEKILENEGAQFLADHPKVPEIFLSQHVRRVMGLKNMLNFATKNSEGHALIADRKTLEEEARFLIINSEFLRNTYQNF